MELKEAIYWLTMNGYEVKFYGSRHVAHTGSDKYINCVVSKKEEKSTESWEYSASVIEEIRFSGLEWGNGDSIKDAEEKMSKLVEELKGNA